MAEPEIGSTIGGYRIEALIARGGMGVVYRATQLALERPVALKVIARDLAGREGFRERFLRESRLAARLDHPAVVPVFDAREEEGELLVAMRLVEGGDLRKLIEREGPLPAPRAIGLLGPIAEALDAAHAAGIVHRDVKPHNILVEGSRAYLSDFGLAKALEETGEQSGASIVGTVEYMAPEQWRGGRIGPAADIYSLGCVLYEALTGIVPFARDAGEAEPRIPQGLEAVIERAVAKDPAARYPSASALIGAARQAQGSAPAATAVLSTPSRATARLGAKRRWSRRWLLVPLALVAALALVLVLTGGGEVSVSAPIPVGSGRLRVAVGEGSVWVSSSGDGVLTQIDPESRAVVAKLRLGKGIAGVAVGEGAVWVSSPDTHSVLRVDPETQRRLEIPIGGRPGAIVVGGGRVWVADEAGSGVTAISAPGGRIFKRGILPHAAPLRLAVGAGAVWVSSASTGSVRRIDLSSGRPGPPVSVGHGPSGVTVGGGILWVANSRSDSVTRLDPATRIVLGEPTAVGGRPGGIDAGTSLVWVANAGEGTVSRLDIESGETVGDPVSVGEEPGAVAVGEQAVWVADNGEDSITRIEP